MCHFSLICMHIRMRDPVTTMWHILPMNTMSKQWRRTASGRSSSLGVGRDTSNTSLYVQICCEMCNGASVVGGLRELEEEMWEKLNRREDINSQQFSVPVSGDDGPPGE